MFTAFSLSPTCPKTINLYLNVYLKFSAVVLWAETILNITLKNVCLRLVQVSFLHE